MFSLSVTSMRQLEKLSNFINLFDYKHFKKISIIFQAKKIYWLFTEYPHSYIAAAFL